MPEWVQWQELAKLLDKHPAKWMIWEATPASPEAEKLKSLGVGCIVFEPCGNMPGQGDYLDAMQRNIRNLKVIVGDA